jgi:hypothetical protein
MTVTRFKEINKLMRERPAQVPAPAPPTLTELAKRRQAKQGGEVQR